MIIKKSEKVYDLNYLYNNFDLDLIEEDFGCNGLDYVKGLSVDELNEEFGDFKISVDRDGVEFNEEEYKRKLLENDSPLMKSMLIIPEEEN